MTIDQYWLSKGDHGSSSDELNLLDLVHYGVEQGSVHIEPEVRNQRRRLTMLLSIFGSTREAVLDAREAVEHKLQQARVNSGAFGSGAPITFGMQKGAAQMSLWDLWDGTLGSASDNETIYVSGHGYVQQSVPLALSAEPNPRAPRQSLGSYSISNGAGTIYLPGLPGSADGLVTLTATDTSTSPAIINGIHIGRMARQSLASGDFSPIIEAVASGSGGSLSDASASGGSCARATLPQPTGTDPLTGAPLIAWTEVAKFVKPASRNTGNFDQYVRVRDGGGLVGTPSGVGLTVANINRVQFTEYNNFSNTSVTQNWPPAWPKPTTSGNTALMFCTQPYSSGGTYSAWPAVAGWTLLKASNGCACYYIPNAAVQRGPVTLPAVTLDTVALVEVAGVASASADGNGTLASGQGAVTTVHANDVVYFLAENVTTASPTGQTVLINRQGTAGSIALTEKMLSSAGFQNNIGPGGTQGDGIIVTFKGSASSNGTAPIATYTTRVAAVVNGFVSAASAPISITPTTCAGVAGCSWTQTWSAPANAPAGTTYYVYWSPDGGTTWYAIPTSSTSLTFSYANGTSPGVGTIQPSSMPLTPREQGNWPVELRLRYGRASGSVTYPSQVVATTQRANGLWEDVYLGTFDPCPQVQGEDGSLHDWVLYVDARSQDGFGQTLDVDRLYQFPHEEPQLRANYQDSSGKFGTLATKRTWVIEMSRWNQLCSVTLLDGSGNEVGTVVPDSVFAGGPGDNLWLVKLLSTGLTSDINASATVAISYSARSAYLHGS